MINKSTDNSHLRSRFTTVTKYLKKYKWYLVCGGIAVLFANVLMLIIPAITGRIIDGLKENAPLTDIRDLVIISMLLAVVSGVFRFGTRRTIVWMSRHLEYDLREEIFNHLLKLTPTFYHQNRTGDIMVRMTNDLEAVRQMAGPAIMYSTNAIVNLIIGFSFMIYFSPKLTLIAMVPLIIMPMAVNKIGNIFHKRQAAIQKHFALLTSTAQENIAGIRVVKAFQQEDSEVNHFSSISQKYINLNMDLARIQGVFIPLMRLVAAVSYLTVFYFGGMAVINGEMTLGTVIAFFGYLGIMHWPVIAVGWVVSLYQRGKASLDRINNVLRTSPDIENDNDDLKKERIKGKIEFRKLSFSYENQKVLDEINLTINPGQSLGLIGQTGSGKTTIVNLIARLNAIDKNQLFIDDLDINQWDLESLRSQIGFATQEPFLFSDTIEENIKFGRYSADEKSVFDASEISDLSKDIDSFPDKFKTIVGERGITLSGGQKQRTAIARAIIIDPSILILDDATSSVDTETEHEIQKRIKTVLEGCTSIIISHRVSSVKDADIIAYLEKGKIVEQGRHDELMKLKGRYADLYHSQLLEQELEHL